MNNKSLINRIFLHGFRATGKTTLAKKLAQDLGWDFVDMDKEIERNSNVPIDTLTKGGTDWHDFRQKEQEILKMLEDRMNVIVSTGGGTTVNNVVNKLTGKTFGEENTEFIKKLQKSVNILLNADEKTIANRIEQTEMSKNITMRPIINEEKAQELMKKLEEYSNDPSKIKEISVKMIVEDAMELFEIRKPLYQKIADLVVDTGKLNIQQSLEQIIDYLAEKLNENKRNN